MATFGRLTNAILSASNENTLALVNMNFDFSIMKFDAPREFHVFGASLSKQRRNEAEDGSAHKTARRLGALFEGLVPATPCLIKAYGTRTSDIAMSPDANPKGSSKDGPFEDYIGADGTSIWAAATSSKSDEKAHSPLAMHLLACMLARAFKSEEAISIWVELVRARRQEIEHKLDSEPQTISACMAARQDITREHLALWDASARSWLRGADEAKKVQRTQLQLVVNNLHLRFANEGSAYETVIHVWRSAMVCVEKCIGGTPQQVSDGSILLALSSWHLYPDLIVAHDTTTKVPFNDTLLEMSGALTIGLELAPGSRPAGVHWSLTLSHLKYYGNAIEVQSSSEIQRFTMNQLLIMVFGNLLQSWTISKDTEEQCFCAKWLIELSDALGTTTDAQIATAGDKFSWIRLLALAGLKYLDLHHSDPHTCSMLLGWGRRRAKKFLGSLEHAPFFHLESPLLTAALQQSDSFEVGVHFLRTLAKEMNLKPGEAVIRSSVKLSRSRRVELITAIPHTKSHSKRTFDGSCLPQEAHCRWIGITVDTTQDISRSSCSCNVCDARCPCATNLGRCYPICHPPDNSLSCVKVGGWAATRGDTITTKLREHFCFLHPQKIHDQDAPKQSGATGELSISDFDLMGKFIWENPPDVFHNHDMPTSLPKSCPSLSNGAAKCTCFTICERPTEYYHDACFTLVHGTMTGLGLFVRTQPEALYNRSKYQSYYAATKEVFGRKAVRSRVMDALHQIKVRESPLFTELMSYMAHAGYSSLDESDGYHFGLVAGVLGVTALPRAYIKSLSLLSMAQELYDELPGATISTDILKTALYESDWLSHNWGVLEQPKTKGLFDTIFRDQGLPGIQSSKFLFPNRSLGRAERFACIALFESGLHHVESSSCEPVIALASANSIFIAEELLTDPATPKKGRVMRVVGNFGRAGISMLVLPQEPPLIRPLGNEWRTVPHEPYNYHREDNLSGTTLVLSFTEWKRPLSVFERGTIDEGLNFVEGVVSLHDRGTWVADLDLMDLRAYSSTFDCLCDDSLNSVDVEVTSIDSWEELLDAPLNVAILRARGNWVARLAAVAIRRQQGYQDTTCVVPPDTDPCLKCLGRVFQGQYMRQSPEKKKTIEIQKNIYKGQIGVIID